MLTQKRLKELFRYDSCTGDFIRLQSRRGYNCKKGDIAGYIHNTNGYRLINVDGKKYRAQRLAWLYMLAKFPNSRIDHKDRNKSNNEWMNLRPLTQSENCKNSLMRSNNTSKITGVYWNKLRLRWYANVMVDYKTICLGSSVDFFEACSMRLSANNKYGFSENHGRIAA